MKTRTDRKLRPFCRDCADHDGICPNSGEPCDPDNVLVEMRSAQPPYKTWRELGQLPFEMYGERFAVTRNVADVGGWYPWKVSHIATGTAIPNSRGVLPEDAKEAAIRSLTEVGETKFKAALARVREAIATA